MAGRTKQAGRSVVAGSSRWMSLALSAILTLAALWMAIPALVRMATLLAYPYPHDGLEGTLLYEARLFRSGQPLYQPLELHRFFSAPYPPVHALLLAIFDLIPGPHIFSGGRLVSFLAALGVALLAGLIVRRAGGGWAAGALAAGLVLSVPPLQLWGTRIKPDLLALLWTSAGLALMTWGGTTEPRNHGTTEPRNHGTTEPGTIELPPRSAFSLQPSAFSLLFAAVCFTLAFFTKQTAVAGALAAGLALFATDLRDWRLPDRRGYLGPLPLRRRTLAFGALYLGLALGTWALLDLVTNGQYTLHVWWGGERAAWWSFGLFSKIVGLLGFWWPQMILAALALTLAWNRRGLFVPVCYALVAPLTLLGAGEQGSHHNHLLETHLALAIAGCAALGSLLNTTAHDYAETTRPGDNQTGRPGDNQTGRPGDNQTGRPGDRETTRPGDRKTGRQPDRETRGRVVLLVVALILAAAQVWQTGQPPAWYGGELVPTDTPERYLNFIRNTPGEILADDTGLLFQAGRDLRYDDPSTMGPAARIGAWDQRGLLEEIAQRKFSAIMIPVNVERSTIDPSGRWTPEMLAAIKEHYQLKFRDTIYTYVPR